VLKVSGLIFWTKLYFDFRVVQLPARRWVRCQRGQRHWCRYVCSLTRIVIRADLSLEGAGAYGLYLHKAGGALCSPNVNQRLVWKNAQIWHVLKGILVFLAISNLLFATTKSKLRTLYILCFGIQAIGKLRYLFLSLRYISSRTLCLGFSESNREHLLWRINDSSSEYTRQEITKQHEAFANNTFTHCASTTIQVSNSTSSNGTHPTSTSGPSGTAASAGAKASSLSIGGIAAGVSIGTIVFLLAVGFLVWFLRKRRRLTKEKEFLDLTGPNMDEIIARPFIPPTGYSTHSKSYRSYLNLVHGILITIHSILAILELVGILEIRFRTWIWARFKPEGDNVSLGISESPSWRRWAPCWCWTGYASKINIRSSASGVRRTIAIGGVSYEYLYIIIHNLFWSTDPKSSWESVMYTNVRKSRCWPYWPTWKQPKYIWSTLNSWLHYHVDVDIPSC
jgi:hypothetical protein